MHDVIVVGGGPAGLTAGLYAARAGLDVILLEKLLAGGQAALPDRIENYPGFPEGIGGPELCMAMERQAQNAGLAIRYETALEIDCVKRRVRTDAGWLSAKRLILAMGAQARRLEVEGEAAFAGRGVSYCATCDGAFYRGKRVAVVGGGNSAAEEALYLAGIAGEVLLIHRRDTLRAEAALAKKVLENKKITLLWNSRVQSVQGGEKVEKLLLDDGREKAVDGMFIAVGRLPDTGLVKGQLDLDELGFIRTNEDVRTSVPGVFAAGDVRVKALRQVITAASDGALAASLCQA